MFAQRSHVNECTTDTLPIQITLQIPARKQANASERASVTLRVRDFETNFLKQILKQNKLFTF